MNYCQFRNLTIKRMAATAKVSDVITAAYNDAVATFAANSDITYTATLNSISYDVGGTAFGLCLAPNGIIYLIPRYGTKIAKIDTSNNDSVTYISLGGSKKYDSGVLSADQKSIYLTPCGAAQIGKLDIATDTITNIGSTLSSSEYKYYFGVTVGNYTYILGGGSKALIIDNSDDSIVTSNYTGGTGNSTFIRPYVMLDNYVYNFVPYTPTRIYPDGTYESVTYKGTNVIGIGDYVLCSDGYYYSFSTGYNMAWRYNISTGDVTTYTSPFSRNTQSIGCPNLTGDIIITDTSKNIRAYNYVREINNVLATVSGVGANQILAPNGDIYLIDDGTLKKIHFTYSRTPQTLQESTLLSPLFNRG